MSARTLAPLDCFLLLARSARLLIESAPPYFSEDTILLNLLAEAAQHALKTFA